MRKRSKILEGEIKNLGLPEDALIGGVIRNNKGLIPTGDFQILPGDKVVVFAKNNCAKKMTRYFR